MSIFTLGYGGRRFVDLVSLLQEHGITFVADVRRFPRSTVTEYNKENLEAKLPQFGISYISMSDTLGGFRPGGYRKYMESDSYRRGINKLLELADQGNVVLMCKERSDAGCHRRYIVEMLANKGMETISLT